MRSVRFLNRTYEQHGAQDHARKWGIVVKVKYAIIVNIIIFSANEDREWNKPWQFNTNVKSEH